MKKFLCALLLLICSYSTNSFAQDRIYVCAKDITITENGIFVNIDGYVGMVNSVHYDDNGIFILPDPITTWICENGHYVSPSSGNTCPKCGGKNRKD